MSVHCSRVRNQIYSCRCHRNESARIGVDLCCSREISMFVVWTPVDTHQKGVPSRSRVPVCVLSTLFRLALAYFPKSFSMRACLVCASEARNQHFGAASCRACAAFFRRTVVLKCRYTCSGRGACNLETRASFIRRFSLEKRRMCRYCRFQKCRQVGMDETRLFRNHSETFLEVKFLSQKKDLPNLKLMNNQEHSYLPPFEEAYRKLKMLRQDIYGTACGGGKRLSDFL